MACASSQTPNNWPYDQSYCSESVAGLPSSVACLQLAADHSGNVDIKYEGEHNHDGTVQAKPRQGRKRQASPEAPGEAP